MFLAEIMVNGIPRYARIFKTSHIGAGFHAKTCVLTEWQLKIFEISQFLALKSCWRTNHKTFSLSADTRFFWILQIFIFFGDQRDDHRDHAHCTLLNIHTRAKLRRSPLKWLFIVIRWMLVLSINHTLQPEINFRSLNAKNILQIAEQYSGHGEPSTGTDLRESSDLFRSGQFFS